jgi:hypothetical protein
MKKYTNLFKFLYIVLFLAEIAGIYLLQMEILEYLYTGLLFVLAAAFYTIYIISANRNRTDFRNILISFAAHTFQVTSVFVVITILFGIINQTYPSQTQLDLSLIFIFLVMLLIYAIKLYELRKEDITLQKTLNLFNVEWLRNNLKLVALPLILIVVTIIILGTPALVLIFLLLTGFITYFLSVQWIEILSKTPLRRIKVKKPKVLMKELEESTNTAIEKTKKKRKKKSKQKKSYS